LDDALTSVGNSLFLAEQAANYSAPNANIGMRQPRALGKGCGLGGMDIEE
jgi:hypothetical protein